MRKGKQTIKGLLAASAMLVIILDGTTAMRSMQDGIALCIRAVIPALFPFFILSGIINSSLLGRSVPFLQPIAKLCRIPKGAESLFIVGCLSGYPVGAQLIAQAYHNGQLDSATAKRMLGFCSNAGPAFLFGMLSPLFRNPAIPWLLWGIHIIGALLAGFILPGAESCYCKITQAQPITLVKSLQTAGQNIATVCGWVVTFRLLLGFCSRWFLWLFPVEMQALFSGLLELSNGCVFLNRLSTDGIRFIFASIMLAFGGMCVGMQTISVTGSLGTGYYFPGKALQMLVCALLSCIFQSFIFIKSESVTISPLVFGILLCVTALLLYLARRKKVVAFNGKMVYNTLK